MLGLLALVLPAAVSARVLISPQPAPAALSPAEMRGAIPLDSSAPAAAQAAAAGAAQPPRGLAPASASRARPSAAKLAGAQPLTGELEKPLSAHGRIFFQKTGSDALYSCSGTVVRSRKRNLIFTAGHCVYDLGVADFNQRITFVPAYREGQAPLGQFPAILRLATSGWISGAGTGHDVGAITVAETLQDRLGGRPVDFDFQARQGSRLSIFGYPALPSPPYDGESPIVCDAAIVTGFNTGTPPSVAATPCDMQQGSSGGGWIDEAGYLVSVVSHGYCDSEPKTCGIIFGPRLAGPGAKIYERAGGSERPRLAVAAGPRGRHTSSRAAFRFRSSASTPVKLECRLTSPALKGRGKAEFRPCGQRRVYRHLGPGRYRLSVRLSDQTGRRAKASRFFRVAARNR